jgi:hypothetical protein
MLAEANTLAAMFFDTVWRAFSRAAAKYKQEYNKIPVLIIDNVNRLEKNQIDLLDEIQEYAKRAADEGTAAVVFVSDHGLVPHRMMGKLILFMALIRLS